MVFLTEDSELNTNAALCNVCIAACLFDMFLGLLDIFPLSYP